MLPYTKVLTFVRSVSGAVKLQYLRSGSKGRKLFGSPARWEFSATVCRSYPMRQSRTHWRGCGLPKVPYLPYLRYPVPKVVPT